MTMRGWTLVTIGAPILLLAACVPVTIGPTVQVMPGAGKSAAVFASDQTVCMSFADQQIAAARAAGNNQMAGNASLGAAVGAIQTSIAGGDGSAVAAGAVSGAQAATTANGQIIANVQRQYDFAYGRCMYTRGNVVPGYAPVVAEPDHYAPRRRAPLRRAPTNVSAPGSAAPSPGFVEPPPAASGSGGFVEPPAAAH